MVSQEYDLSEMFTVYNTYLDRASIPNTDTSIEKL